MAAPSMSALLSSLTTALKRLGLLALAVVFSLVLGVGLAWARGAEFVRVPTWWPPAGQTAQPPGVALADVSSATPPGAAVQPPAASVGAMAE